MNKQNLVDNRIRELEHRQQVRNKSKRSKIGAGDQNEEQKVKNRSMRSKKQKQEQE